MAKSHKNKRLNARFGKKSVSNSSASKPKKELSKKIDQSRSLEKRSFYDKYYKQLLIIPFLMLLFAFIVIGWQYSSTGDFMNKGISLKGGTAITITSDIADISSVSIPELELALKKDFPKADINIRTQKDLSELVAIDVEVDITNETQLAGFKNSLIKAIPGLTLDEIGQNIKVSGSSLGATFFSQMIKAMIIAFILMGIVVFIQFKVPTPSLAVILAAFSDIVVTLAIVDLMGIKISTAGIAAFLMLIGYSVDTDVLLSTRVLKNTEGSVHQRVISALKTGLTMNITTLVAVGVGLLVSESVIISQIMTIIFIGLLVDMVNTWIQNVGILRLYLEKKDRRKKLSGDVQ